MEVRGRQRTLAIALAVCVFVALASVASAGAPKLGKSIKVGFDPFDVAAGDFNDDGRTDLAVANFAASVNPHSKTSISILAGQKGGGYKLVKTLPSAQPDGIAVDRVGSGKEPDLVVSALTGSVEVYKGGKGFKFAHPKTTAVTGEPRDVVTGDFNHDARTDVAVTRQDAGDVRVLYAKKGSKGFGSAQSFAGASDGGGIISGRLNRDNLLDLVATNDLAGKFTVMLGKKHGGFKVKTYSQPNATSATIADFDQDGNKDVAVATGTASVRSASRGGGGVKPAIALYKGSASGKLHKDRTLKPKGLKSSFGLEIASARLNGDPDPDLVLGSTAGSTRPAKRSKPKGSLSILYGKHGLSFENGKTIKIAGSATQIGLLAGGGSDDLAIPIVPNNGPGSVRILAGD